MVTRVSRLYKVYRTGWFMPPLVIATLVCGMSVAMLGAGPTPQGTDPYTDRAADASGPEGIWYLTANSYPLTVTITRNANGAYQGTLINESAQASNAIDNISWDASSRRLEFRRVSGNLWQWYRGTVVEGILVGRFSHSKASPARPAQLASYAYHVTGWNSSYLDQDIVPRVYDILVDRTAHAKLRIDRSPYDPDHYIGRLKFYGKEPGVLYEGLEYDLEVIQWDGRTLTFLRHLPGSVQIFTGITGGRKIYGTFTQTDSPASSTWTGTRAEVLGYGLQSKSADDRALWQSRTRRQLYHLLMAGNPAPLTRRVTALANMPPIAARAWPPDRDDNPDMWPQNYRLTELQFDYTLPNPYGGPALVRRSHGYLAKPTTPPTAGAKYPAVLTVNGHGGSAYQVMDPNNALFWYGDAFARRGFVVLAIDISHRPGTDRLTWDQTYYLNGDDALHGNGSHPAIKAPGFDSDWEEDGERAWDAMRGLDYLFSLPFVDTQRVLITGLSLGGEITTITGGLDPRVSIVIPSGFSPDWDTLVYNTHRCWQGLHSNIQEYMNVSDYHALIAPRLLIVETGKKDFVFSLRPEPFAADKQVVRRSRAAYGDDVDNLVHYLHYDAHHFHAGDINPTHAIEPGVNMPSLIEPISPWTLDWQTDGNTSTDGSTVFDLINSYYFAFY